MSPDGGGDPPGRSPDLTALPTALVRDSLSATQIILPLDAALTALGQLSQQGRRLECWEGWVKMPDGGRTKSLTHGGSFALPRDAGRALESATAGMRRAQAHWDRDPEYPGAQLYFALYFGSA